MSTLRVNSIINSDSTSSNLNVPDLSRLVRETAQTTTSGTSKDFSSIPSWVQKITVMFQNISLSGTDNFLIQLEDSGGVETTGYISSSNFLQGGVSSGGVSSTSGIILSGGNASNTLSGTVVFNNISGNFWIATGTWNYSNLTGINGWTAGEKELSSTLTSIRITASGANTFDLGSVNIMYEG